MCHEPSSITAGLDILSGPLREAARVKDVSQLVQNIASLKQAYNVLGYAGYAPDSLNNKLYEASAKVQLQAGVEYEFRFETDAYVLAKTFTLVGGQCTFFDVTMAIDSLSVEPTGGIVLECTAPPSVGAGQVVSLSGTCVQNGSDIASATVFVTAGSKKLGASVSTDALGRFSLPFRLSLKFVFFSRPVFL